MKIISIDPGTATTGFALLEIDSKESKPVLLEANTFLTSSELEPHDRLEILYSLLFKKISDFKPNRIVLEKLFFNTNVKTAISVGQARGVMLLCASQLKLEVFEYTALQAKLVLTGYGRSNKKEMQEAVRNYFQLEKVIKPDDASDAVALGLCHIHKEIYKESSKDSKNKKNENIIEEN